MNSQEMQHQMHHSLYGIRTHDPALAQYTLVKRKPRLNNEGRDPCEDRKRTKKHSTITGSQKSLGRCSTKSTHFSIDTTVKPIYMTASSMQEIPLQNPKLCTPTLPTRLTQRAAAAAATLTKLVFPPPPLGLPTATDFISKDQFPQCRRASYERRHGGPHIPIYEDDTATDKVLFSSDYSCFPWNIAQVATRSGTDNTERDQENDPVRVRAIPTPGSVDRRSPLISFTLFADDMAMAGRVPKRALEILREMR